jgi:hypothetical protein
MVALLKKNRLLTRNGESHFDDLVHKRNYLAHSLYDLFTAEIDESILERENLVKEDVDIFIYRAEGLTKDFLLFVDIVLKAKGEGQAVV